MQRCYNRTTNNLSWGKVVGKHITRAGRMQALSLLLSALAWPRASAISTTVHSSLNNSQHRSWCSSPQQLGHKCSPRWPNSSWLLKWGKNFLTGLPVKPEGGRHIWDATSVTCPWSVPCRQCTPRCIVPISHLNPRVLTLLIHQKALPSSWWLFTADLWTRTSTYNKAVYSPFAHALLIARILLSTQPQHTYF